MRSSSRVSLCLCAVALMGCTGAATVAQPIVAHPEPVAAEPASELEQRVETALLPALQVQGQDVHFSLAERMAALKVPGLGIAVFDASGVIWAKGYGVADAETRAPVTRNTLFQAASISKSVNALAVLLAADQGTLTFDAPVNDLLKSWHLPENELTRESPVTLRQLLSHTAGTTVHGFPGYPTGAPLPTVVQVLDGSPPANTPAVRVDQRPGARFRYSGGGTTIAQLTLTDSFGKPYPALLRELVLAPLGMTSSTYEQPLPAELIALAAAGHDELGAVIATRRHVYPEMAAAGLWTTPTDLALFFRELALARADSSSRLRPELVREMTREVDPDSHAALGVFLSQRNGTTSFGHTGKNEGFQANVWASQDGVYGLAVMANSANGMRLFPELERTVCAAMRWPCADVPVTELALSASEREPWLGDFILPEGIPFRIESRGDRLVQRFPLREPVELVAVSARTTRDRNTGFGYTLADDGLDVDRPGGPSVKVRRVPAGSVIPLLELAAGRVEEAAAAWRRSNEAKPNSPEAGPDPCLGYGYELLRNGESQAAVQVFRLCVAVWPALPFLETSLARAYEAAGDAEAAILHDESALDKLSRATWLPPARQLQLREQIERALHRLRSRRP